jgi:glycosyltransferase involved in cell wall biosynthesis
MTTEKLRVVAWGTYDLGKPRTRILLCGLREAGVPLTECHVDVWNGVEDKSQLSGWRQIVNCVLKLLLAYPTLVWRYLRLPPHDVVIVGYFGHFDILVLWPFARLRGVPVLWDAFLSLYETAVEDRAMVSPRHPIAWLLWIWDWLACRAADIVLLDTRAHAKWFESEFGLKREQAAAIFVGAEPEAFAPSHDARASTHGMPVRVLFYGQFIPLHGIQTIIEAAAKTKPGEYFWTVIGTGQEAPKIRRLLDTRPISHLEWLPWVPYSDLQRKMTDADICLGIFGQGDKAARVIPNKVFQAISAGRPLVTRDSPAMRELVEVDMPGIRLVAPGDSDALLDGIAELSCQLKNRFAAALFEPLRDRLTPLSIGRELEGLLSAMHGRWAAK